MNSKSINESNPLVSIITPYCNAELTISETIKSVIDQSYDHWELILVNDGSTDNSQLLAHSFKDPRIFHKSQKNAGVSAARNSALELISGEILCFLDADDILTKESISSRVSLITSSPFVDYVDGQVIYTDQSLKLNGKHYKPSFRGKPKNELLRLNEKCLFGNTWMIRIRENVSYRFDETLTHAEDLFFYLSICQQSEGLYDYVDTPILYYRRTGQTAMANLDGLERGYAGLLQKIKTQHMATWWQLAWLKLKVTKIMFLSHLIDGKKLLVAIRVLFRYILI